VQEADETLGERLRVAERYSVDMRQSTAAGAELLQRIIRITGVQCAEPEPAPEPAPAPRDARSIVAAAQAFAERTRARVQGLAA
jgi:hypothetical protein